MRSKQTVRTSRNHKRGSLSERNGVWMTRLMAERGPAGRSYVVPRRFHRWQVSIPCRYSWDSRFEDGSIANLSFGGALIRHSAAAPIERETLSLRLEIDDREVLLPARVIHRRWEMEGEEMIGYMGIAFDDPIPALRQKLLPAFRRYAA